MKAKKNTNNPTEKNSVPPENNSGEGQMGLLENRDHTTGSKMNDRRMAETGDKQIRKPL